MCSFGPEVRARLPQHHHYFMDVIEHNLRLWIKRHATFERLAHQTAAQLDGAGHVSAEMLITCQATNIVAAVVGLTESFVELVNSHRVYGAPPVVRSLYETSCVPCYMARELLPRIRKGKGTNEVHRLLFRLGLGVGPFAGYGRVRPIGVPALKKAAEAWIDAYLRAQGATDLNAEGISEMIYGPLSNRSHPNSGLTGVGAAWGPGGATYTLRPEFDQDIVDQLLSGTFFMLIIAGEALDEVVAACQEHSMPFPPGDPQFADGDLMTDAEASVLVARGLAEPRSPPPQDRQRTRQSE